MPIVRAHYRGFTLVEFVISMALSMMAIMMIFSIFVSSFMLDNNNIKFTRLADEVANVSAVFTEDLKRAGYVSNAQQLLLNPSPSTNLSRCASINNGCSNIAFRTLTISQFGTESLNSCITFAYDHDHDGLYNFSTNTKANNSDAMGYRLKNHAIEVRQLSKSCSQGYWRRLTDPAFVQISELTFVACGKHDDSAKKCANFSFPPQLPSLSPPQGSNNDQFRISFSFKATLTNDDTVSITTSQSLVVRNVSYD